MEGATQTSNPSNRQFSTSIGMTNNTSEDVADGFGDNWVSGTVANEPSSPRVLISTMNRKHGEWTCFLCCHVRTGTIVIGFWHMLLDLMALSLIAVAVVHPEMLSPYKFGDVPDRLSVSKPLDVQSINCTRMPCLLAGTQVNNRFHHGETVMGDYSMVAVQNLLPIHRINSGDVNVGIFITVVMFLVTLLLVYGVFRGQPSHLMPFFFFQVFEFCISSMTMIGYLSYLPNVRQIIKDVPIVPLQRMLLSMDTNCLVLFVIWMVLCAFMVKAYCIGIIWRCYKFLMLRAQGEGGFSNVPAGPLLDQESQTLVLGHDLPDYNTAIADPQYRKKISSLFPDPPPSYDMAMTALFAQTVHLPPDQSSTSADNTSSTDPLLVPPPTPAAEVQAAPQTSSNSENNQQN